MGAIRRAGWFVLVAFAMAAWVGVLGSIRSEAVAGVIASRGTGAAGAIASRAADLDKVQAFLESRIVVQKLVDYGVSSEEAMAKVRSMSDGDLHRLASLADRAGEGADDALGFLIGVAILVILVIVILKLVNKEVIVR
ncbi:MAG: PA2779 family protein [Gemmatimonadota bacterium]